MFNGIERYRWQTRCFTDRRARPSPATGPKRRLRSRRSDLAIVTCLPLTSDSFSDVINDFDFLPFNDRILLTCCRDEKATDSHRIMPFIESIILPFQLKLWRFDDENANLASTQGEPFQAIDLGADRYLECLATHPTTDDIIAVGSGDGAIIVDLQKCTPAMGQSFCNLLHHRIIIFT